MSIFNDDDFLKNEDGIFYVKNESNIVSYPEDGNAVCLQLEDQSFWFKHRNQCIIELVKQCQINGPFLDIGGGNGFVSAGLQNAGIDVCLIEPGEQGCKNARKRGIKTIVCGTLQAAPIKIGNVNSMGIFDVLEHIEDDVAFLKNLYDYLTPNGLLFITVPAYSFLFSQDDVDAGHFRRYTLSKLEEKLKIAGFEIKYKSYIFSLLPLPIFFFRTLKSIFFKNVKKEIVETQKEHKSGKLNKILDKLWSWELSKVKKKSSLPFGGSCLVLAQKRNKK